MGFPRIWRIERTQRKIEIGLQRAVNGARDGLLERGQRPVARPPAVHQPRRQQGGRIVGRSRLAARERLEMKGGP